MVEHGTENAGVDSSILSLGTTGAGIMYPAPVEWAEVAQW